MYKFLITLQLQPGSRARILAAAPPVQALTRAEPGCIEYADAQDVLDAGLIHVHELWRSQDDLDRHFASAHIAQWRALWPALGIGGRDLRAYAVGAPRPV